jgi:hypothetical protein
MPFSADDEDELIEGDLTEVRRFAITELRVGGVDWGETEPAWNRMPAPDPDTAVEYRCHIDPGSDWCAVSEEVADELGLREFDAASPTTLSHPQEGLEQRRGTCITVVVGRQTFVAPAYIGLPRMPLAEERRDVLIGTWVLRHLRFTYDGPDGTYSIRPS